MDDNYESWRILSAHIIIEVIEDYRATSDHYRKEALLRWFDSAYGNNICALAGMDPDYIKREVQKIEKDRQAYITDDHKRIKKAYKEAGEKSQYKAPEYKQAKEGSIESCTGGDRLLEAFRYYQQKRQGHYWLPYS